MKKTAMKLCRTVLIGSFVWAGIGASVASAQEVLNVLTWEGYADELWVSDFETEHGVTVNRTYVGSNDEYMAKIATGGGGYDVVTIVSSLAQTAIGAGFVSPLELEKIPNYDQIFEGFRSSAINRKDGVTYGVPTFWGTSPMTYNADEVTENIGFGVLFDPQYKGRISMWDDVSTIGDVANYLGYENLWTLSDEQLDQVKATMIEQRPLIRKYWSNAGEAIELFTSGEIVASNSWNYITQAVSVEGINVAEYTPERAIGWMDSHFIVKGSEQQDLAHAYINHLISAEAQGEIAGFTGYTVTNPASKEHMTAEVWEGLYMDEAPQLLPAMSFWEEIPRRGKYLEVWAEIKAAIQ